MTDTIENLVVICGLPGSGKTTFLAALWHVIFERQNPESRLKFDSLKNGDFAHLNAITRRWQQAKEQIHTEASSGKIVSVNLRDDEGRKIRMTLPDLSGESYQQMWEQRECDPQLASLLDNGQGILMFVHANRIRRAIGVAEVAAQAAAFGGKAQDAVVADEWHPKDAPTAVQVVEMLQMIRCKPLSTPARRLAIVLSAWDKVEDEGLTPEAYLQRDLPLLDQYLRQGTDGWAFRIYGLSAQGGDYERQGETDDPDRQARVTAIREIEDASSRIRLMLPELSIDLTEPIAWLTE